MSTTLTHGQAKATTATVHHCGATVTSWVVEGAENLFVSSKAITDGSKAIRGGIPICFPQFGPWEAGPQHGFARSSNKWAVKEAPAVCDKTGDAKVTFSLTDGVDSWPNKFELLYTVTLTSRTIVFDVSFANKESSKDWDFTFCLHTYFKVPDATAVTISGLQGLKYDDKTDGGKDKTQDEELVTIKGFTDRVYKKSPEEAVLKGLANGRAIRLTKKNFCDTVVWNPWIENAAKMADFGDDEYKGMVCVEAVQFTDRVPLKAGEVYEASHTLAVMD